MFETIVKEKGELIASNKLSLPTADGVFFHVDSLMASNDVPDLQDVLHSIAVKFGWSIPNPDCDIKKKMAELDVESIREETYHVIHLRYYDDGYQHDSFCQLPHMKYYVEKSRDTVQCSVESKSGIHDILLGVKECVYSIYSIRGDVLFPIYHEERISEHFEPSVEDAPRVDYDPSSWWNSMTHETNPVIIANILTTVSERLFTLDDAESLDLFQNRVIDEEMLFSQEYLLFRSALLGITSLSKDLHIHEVERKKDAHISDISVGRVPELVVTLEGFFNDQNYDKQYEAFCRNAIQSKLLTPADMLNKMTQWNHSMQIKKSSSSRDFIDIDKSFMEKMNELLEEMPSDEARSTFLQDPLNASLQVLSALTTTPRNGISKAMCGVANELEAWSLLDLQQRCAIWISINSLLFDTFLAFLDVTTTDENNLGALVRIYKYYLFTHLKKDFLFKTLAHTSSNNSKNSNPGYQSSSKGLPAQIRLDNFLASKSRERNESSIFESKNCFVQAFQQLHLKDSKIYRFIFSTDRVFHIQFEKESGIDAGGVFREGVTRIIEDLFLVNDFNLLTLTPNMDSFLPNHRLFNDSLSIQMLEFVGKLMGMSLRAKLTLPFSFPSILWKLLIGEQVGIGDLYDIDPDTARHIDHLMSFLDSSQNIDSSKASFDEKYGEGSEFYFCFINGDGVEEGLIENGHSVQVTFSNLQAYCDALLWIKLHMYDKGIKAMAKGLDEVVPLFSVCLFSWRELEILVAGQAVFNIPLWQANTECLPTLSPLVVELFWKVMEKLTSKEQEGFVRFAWGRSRLPNTAEEFVVKMKLGPAGSADAKLPIAHTCFFQIELPNYKTEEEMRHGLLTVIHFGGSGILLG